VLGPFAGTIDGLGRPAAADKLRAFLASSPALKDLGLNADTIESHSRAFNQFRNATLHYAGLPREVKLVFGSGRTLKVKRDASHVEMVRALAYYTEAFKDLLVMHFARSFGVSSPWGEERVNGTLQGFFRDGLYNGHDWVKGAFKDEVVQA
jgi:hypothetical protein